MSNAEYFSLLGVAGFGMAVVGFIIGTQWLESVYEKQREGERKTELVLAEWNARRCDPTHKGGA